MKKARITAETREQIESMLKSGMTGADIAYATGCSQATICKIRKQVEASGYNLWHKGGALSAYAY